MARVVGVANVGGYAPSSIEYITSLVNVRTCENLELRAVDAGAERQNVVSELTQVE